MSLHSEFMRHQIFLQRLSGTANKVIIAHLNELHKAAKLAVATGQVGAPLTMALRKSIGGLAPDAIAGLTDLAKYEAEFSAKLIAKKLKQAVAYVTETKIVNKLLGEAMQLAQAGDGTKKSIATAYKQFANRKADEIAQIIKDGQTKGMPMQDIASMVGARINGQHKSQAKVLSKTAVNYTASLAREEAIQEAGIKQVVWELGDADVHTEYCLDQEGEVYDVGDGPRPPAHWGCVSHMEPYLDE